MISSEHLDNEVNEVPKIFSSHTLSRLVAANAAAEGYLEKITVGISD